MSPPLRQILTRSIEAKLDLPDQYRGALKLARRFERDAPGLSRRLPEQCPYTFEQILSSGDEDWFLTATDVIPERRRRRSKERS